MKSFDFPLDKVRLYREKQAQVEESKLERLYTGRRTVEVRRDTLNRHRSETERSLLSAQYANAAELAALDRWGRFVEQQNQVFAKQLAQCDAEITTQRARVMEARRQFQLLDKLKEKRLAIWRAACNRELEQQAAESYLARWSKEQGLVESG